MEGVQWVVKGWGDRGSLAARVAHFWWGEAPERSKTRGGENGQLDAEKVTLGPEARRAVPWCAKRTHYRPTARQRIRLAIRLILALPKAP
jgi:hypothetical protein